MHLDEERLQRLLHGELDLAAEREAQGHVAACEACRLRLDEARREETWMHGLLEQIDPVAPPAGVDADAIARRARAGAEPGTPTIRRSAWLKTAAGVALAATIAGAAFAIPGSPVRGWTRALVRNLAGESVTNAPSAPGRTGTSGVAVPPGDRLVIVVEAGPGGAACHVLLTEAGDVQVRAPAGSATFTSSRGYLLLRGRDSTSVFEIHVPRSAPSVEIRSGDRQFFLKEGPEIRTAGTRDASGGAILSLPPSPGN